MSENTWTPPMAGTPCWVEIPGTDVPRAKQFYSQVFHWSFHPATAECQESKIALFDFPDKKFPASGGICAVKKEDHVSNTTAAGTAASQGKKAINLYLYVDGDLEGKMEEIVSHGGKKLSGVEPEGDSGFMMHFEDTEGNNLGIYTVKKK